MNKKQLLSALGVLILSIVSFSAGYWLNGGGRGSNEELVDAAFRAISSDSFFNKQTDRELSNAAIRGMINSINDPYAELIEPQAAQNFSQTFAGQTGVVGLYAENKGEQVVISIVFPDGSADKAGLRVGDIILAIDSVTLDKSTDSSETGLMLRGLPETKVHLKILRDNQVLEYDLVRQVRSYVNYQMLPGEVGYIALTAFNQTATQQMKEGLEALMTKKPIGLIWDLRNNEGGDMQAAQDILSYFIKDGLLFTAELPHDRTFQFFSNGKSIAEDIPLIVLMDKTTYSAGETCAAAVAETGRGKIIGSSSFGKGVIQATIPLLDDTLLQMTIARWLSPLGEWYQDRGVPPQIEVIDDPTTETDEILQTAVEIFSQKR